MRDGERFWWAESLFALVCGVAGVIVPYLLLSTAPFGSPYAPASDNWQYLGFSVGFAVLLLGMAVGIAIASVRTRNRHRLRVAAWNGDEAAMPPAKVHLDPALAPDVEAQSLELLWRANRQTRFLAAPASVLKLISVLVSVGLALFALVAPTFLPAQPSPDDPFAPPPQPMTPLEIALRLAAAGVFVVAVTVAAIYIGRALPLLFGRPYGVVATAFGIAERTAFGNRKRMAWHEMRLLEATQRSRTSRRGFALYAPGTRIGWIENRAGLQSDSVPVGVSASEIAVRQEALLGLIAARTGLTPRTLSPKLMLAPTSAPVRSQRGSTALGLLVLALIVGALAAAEALFPLTPYGWMNWASVASLGLLALGCVAGALRAVMPVPQPFGALAGPPTMGVPSLEALQAGYSYNWPAPMLRRVVIPAAGLCLAINLLPSGWALVHFGAVMLSPFQPGSLANTPFPSVGQFMLAFVLVALGVSGLGFAYNGAITTVIQVRVDCFGLSVGRGRTQRRIPWSGMEDISWGIGAGGQASYHVKSSPPTILITWPTGPRAMDALPPSDGTMSLGPDELAALVAVKLGQPIRVRE